MVLEKVKAILSEQFDVEEVPSLPTPTFLRIWKRIPWWLWICWWSIEDEFEIEVPDEEIENIKTVDQLVKYIEANMK